MSRHSHIQEILDLCEEQGFRYEPLARNRGICIFPKDRSITPITIYWSSSGPNDQKNHICAARRIGIVFPVDEQRARSKEKEIMSNQLTIKKNGNGTEHAPTPAPTVAASESDDFIYDEAMRKIGIAISALADVEAFITKAKEDYANVKQLKALLQKFV